VWSCFDAGNDEFVRGAADDRYCLLLDHDKCLRAVAEAHEAVQLRVPGEAACLRLDDPNRALSQRTCDDEEQAQRWKFDPAMLSFRHAVQESLCLDYQVEDQVWTVWPCAQQQEEEMRGIARIGEHGFVYHRYAGKYCLRRGSGSTCVMVAPSGSNLLLRLPASRSAECLRFSGRERLVANVECDLADQPQHWVWHSGTGTFRAATDASVCLDLFHHHTGERGSALGAWPCIPKAPNERFAFDRFMSRYCVTSQPSVCVMEAIPGVPLRLRHPGSVGGCLHFDGALRSLQERPCNASDPRQQWVFDGATLLFHHAGDSRRCIEFFAAHGSFGVWMCRDDLEVNLQQQFRYDEDRDLFCLHGSDRQTSRCLQEATSSLLY
jgi:hypothetical protein